MDKNLLLNVPEAINKMLENYKIVIVPKDTPLAQLKHGQWLERNSGLCMWIRCSVCNYRQHYTAKTNYCPNCGAKMDEI